MDWFFTDKINGDYHTIIGEDAFHISKSLRMSIGENITLCDNNKTEYFCEISAIDKNSVTVHIINSKPSNHEPNINITLFQCMPKGDKMEFVIQKAIEIGVHEIIPIINSRCISRPDGKQISKKFERYNKIALQASMQSRRAIIPKVRDIVSFKCALDMLSNFDCIIVFYECGGQPLKNILSHNSNIKNIAILIGSEGGFDISEIESIKNIGGKVATLGNRILRTETAPLVALSAIMYEYGNFD